MTVPRYHPLDPGVRENPYPYYAALRREAPVYRIPDLGIFAVTRYRDVVEVLRSPDVFSSAAMAAAVMRPTQYVPEDAEGEPFDEEARSVIGTDGPAHARLRNIVNRGFTPRRIAGLEPRIREMARELVEAFAPQGECDLIADFAAQLPAAVIGELLGIDPDRRRDFKRWADAMVRAAFDSPDEEESKRITACIEEMGTHLDEIVEERKRRPKDDLISVLLRAEEVDGALTVDELSVFVFTLLVAGSTTTAHLIGNTMLALFENPDARVRVTQDSRLVPGMIEEALRRDTPVHLLLRTATRDVELGGTKIPEGATLAPVFASANRDERVFPDPDHFDIDRDPKEHIAFGHGIHFCLGAALARLEARVAFEELLSSLKNPVLLEDRIEWVESLTFRGPTRLRLGFEGLPVGR